MTIIKHAYRSRVQDIGYDLPDIPVGTKLEIINMGATREGEPNQYLIIML